MDKDKLLPCPFCSNIGKITHKKDGKWNIGCKDLDCFAWQCLDHDCDCSDGYVDKDYAIKAWNRRADKLLTEEEIYSVISIRRSKKSTDDFYNPEVMKYDRALAKEIHSAQERKLNG